MAEKQPLPDVAILGDKYSQDVRLAGGKASVLGELLEDGYNVPRGFVLLSNAFDREGPLLVPMEKASKLWSTLRPPVAVRSSGVDEDGAEHSFAGQHETYLNVKDLSDVMFAIWQCWQSAFSARVMDYRVRNGLSLKPQIAVLVQEMIQPTHALVAFSRNPVTKSEQDIVINVAPGLGEKIVSGQVNPIEYILPKNYNADPNSAAKGTGTIIIYNGDYEKKDRLTHSQLLSIVNLSNSLEKRQGHAVDIEAAFVDEMLYLLQCRPVTV